MKKILLISILLVFASTTIANSAEQFSLSSYLNKQVSKVEQKENEINAKLDAQRKENEAKMAKREKIQLEQQKALEAKRAEIEKKREENKKTLEQAKKDAEATNENIKNEINFWKSLFSTK